MSTKSKTLTQPSAADLFETMIRILVPPLPADATRKEKAAWLDAAARAIAGVPLAKLGDRIPAKDDPDRLPTLQQVLFAAFALRWNDISVATVRVFVEWNSRTKKSHTYRPLIGELTGREREASDSGDDVRFRRPAYDRCDQFFADLRRYGRVEFRADGTVDESTYHRGPSPKEFRDYTPGGFQAPAKRKRAA